MKLKQSTQWGSLIIFILYLFAINNISNASNKTDFQISTEPSPSLILQQKPRLFPAPDGSFMMIWEDYRLGERSYFAQRFDSTGTPVGSNFPIIGNADMDILSDGTAMVIGMFTEQNLPFGEDYYIVKGQVLPPFGIPQQPFHLGRYLVPDCGTGFWGLDAQLVAAKNSFLFIFNYGGALVIKRLNPDGRVIFNSDDELSLPQTVATFSLAVNSRDEYVLLWFNADPHSTGLPSGIFATFFNQNDTICTDHLLVKQYQPRYRDQYLAPKLRAVAVSDTLFQFFWADADSLTLSYVIYNASGQALTAVTSLDLQFLLPGYENEIYNFTFTNFRYEVFGLLMTLATLVDIPTMPDLWFYYTQIYWFDKQGDRISSSSLDKSEISALGDNLVQLAPKVIACPLEISNDVFLCTRNDSSWLDSLRVNDDLLGSNQISPRTVIKDSLSFYISWKNENGFYGRAIDLEGNRLGDEQLLEGDKILFLANNVAITFWQKFHEPEYLQLGMTLYDTHTWNIIKRMSIYGGEFYNTSYFCGSISISDSSFIVLIVKRGDAFLINYSSNGQILAEKNIGRPFGYSMDILQNDSDSFWVIGGGKTQLFSNLLQPLSSIFELRLSPLPILHFGRGRFLKIFQSWNPPGYFATVIDTSATQLSNFQLTDDYHANNFSLTRLDSTKFLAMWTGNKQIYARSFTLDGNPVTELLTIYADSQSYADWGNACVNNDKILFAWADTRNYGQGYDIYGRIYDFARITPVIQMESEQQTKSLSAFAIERIYPNPFNSLTTIDFSLTYQAMIQLEIFNIEGKKVKTLLAEQKSAGHFEVQWDGSGDFHREVASGIYFFRLQASSQSSEAVAQVQKLMLLR
ncbi:MAG: T9SS type A sorting domain-containing protein [bacterium]|nr:T9SS type A sorting domain-containing protein [bacterium]